jgi:hypothetical protein
MAAMPGRPELAGRHPSTIALIVVYVLVLAAGSFQHHDFACHENSRTHCTACQTNQAAQKVEVSSAPADVIQRLAGRLEPSASHVVETLTSCRISDRSPPAA